MKVKGVSLGLYLQSVQSRLDEGGVRTIREGELHRLIRELISLVSLLVSRLSQEKARVRHLKNRSKIRLEWVAADYEEVREENQSYQAANQALKEDRDAYREQVPAFHEEIKGLKQLAKDLRLEIDAQTSEIQALQSEKVGWGVQASEWQKQLEIWKAELQEMTQAVPALEARLAVARDEVTTYQKIKEALETEVRNLKAKRPPIEAVCEVCGKPAVAVNINVSEVVFVCLSHVNAQGPHKYLPVKPYQAEESEPEPEGSHDESE